MKPKIDYKLDLHAPVMEAQGNATIPVAWCFKPDSPLRGLFEAERWQNPHLLLFVSVPDGTGGWTDKAVYGAKVTEALKYISFRSPGRNRVRAVIVDLASNYAKNMYKDLLHRKRFEPGIDMSNKEYDHYDSIGLGVFNRKIYDENAEFMVEVPQEFFAAPPTGFKKAVINFWWGEKAHLDDACDSRKKAWVIGAPLWLVTLPYAYIAKLLAVVVALAMGSRALKEGVFWKALVHPMRGVFNMIAAAHDGTSVYIRPKDKDGRQQDPWFERDDKKALLGLTLFLNPAIWFGPATITYVISRIKYHHNVGKGESKHEVYTRVADWSYWTAMWKTDRFILGGLALLTSVALVAGSLVYLWDKIDDGDMLSKAKKALVAALTRSPLSDEDQEKERQQMLTQLALLACGPDGAPMSVGQLPKELRTMSLRFNELKTKVCKPFAS